MEVDNQIQRRKVNVEVLQSLLTKKKSWNFRQSRVIASENFTNFKNGQTLDKSFERPTMLEQFGGWIVDNIFTAESIFPPASWSI